MQLTVIQEPVFVRVSYKQPKIKCQWVKDTLFAWFYTKKLGQKTLFRKFVLCYFKFPILFVFATLHGTV